MRPASEAKLRLKHRRPLRANSLSWRWLQEWTAGLQSSQDAGGPCPAFMATGGFGMGAATVQDEATLGRPT